MFELDYLEIIGRLIASIFFGAIIGYEREIKGHSAGLRTHILVCVGATLFSLVQLQATYTTIKLALESPDLLQILNTDLTRMTAQIVSGIGFLGAGTIIVTKRSVTGLTTAASIWATASLGIAIGMGFYFIALSGSIMILLVLMLIRKLFRVQNYKTLEVSYYKRRETKKAIQDYFDKHQIIVIDLDFLVDSYEQDNAVYLVVYTLNIPDNLSTKEVVEDLSDINSVIGIRTIKDL
ncbi:MAG: MgtC/SapB family protein [Carnobacterium sp.]